MGNPSKKTAQDNTVAQEFKPTMPVNWGSDHRLRLMLMRELNKPKPETPDLRTALDAGGRFTAAMMHNALALTPDGCAYLADHRFQFGMQMRFLMMPELLRQPADRRLKLIGHGLQFHPKFQEDSPDLFDPRHTGLWGIRFNQAFQEDRDNLASITGARELVYCEEDHTGLKSGTPFTFMSFESRGDPALVFDHVTNLLTGKPRIEFEQEIHRNGKKRFKHHGNIAHGVELVTTVTDLATQSGICCSLTLVHSICATLVTGLSYDGEVVPRAVDVRNMSKIVDQTILGSPNHNPLGLVASASHSGGGRRRNIFISNWKWLPRRRSELHAFIIEIRGGEVEVSIENLSPFHTELVLNPEDRLFIRV